MAGVPGSPTESHDAKLLRESRTDRSFGKTNIAVNKDFYGLTVCLRLTGKPKWTVPISMAVTLALFLIQFTMIKTIVAPELYKTVFTSSCFIWWMKLGFLFLNWCSFQLPILLHAQTLFMINCPLGEFLGAIQILALFPIAYFSASLICAQETSIGLLYSYLKLGIVMGLDDALLQALTRVVNYYGGDDFVSELVNYEVEVERGTESRALFRKLKKLWPPLLLLVSYFRWLEGTGPIDFHFPQPKGAEHFYEKFYKTMGNSLSYKPSSDLDISELCKKEDSKMPMLYVTDAAFKQAADRSNPHLAQSGIVCAPKYALVPEPWMIPAFSNSLTWVGNLLGGRFGYIHPGAGKVPKKYLDKGEPGNKEGDELRLASCAVCGANGMTCIPADHHDCSDAAELLDAETMDASVGWPLNQVDFFRNVAEHVRGLEHYKSFVLPLLKTMERTDCVVRPTRFKGFQALFVQWHVCELPA